MASLPTFHQFCQSRFWDANLTWYTDNPDFTPCFQKTVLVWMPCAVLWLFLPLEIYLLLKSKQRRVHFSSLNITKIFLILLLAILSALKFGRQVYQGDFSVVDNLAATIKLATYLLASFFSIYGKKVGTVSSGIELLFWFLTTVAETITYRSAIIEYYFKNHQDDYTAFVMEMVNFPLIVVTLFLNMMTDSGTRDYKNVYEMGESIKKSPEEEASFLSRMSFSWLNSFILNGWREPMEPSDVYELNDSEKALTVSLMFEKYWQYNRDEMGDQKMKSKRSINQNYSIGIALFKTIWPFFLAGGILQILADVVAYSSTAIVRWTIAYSSSEEPLWVGIFYACLIGLAGILQTFFLEGSAFFHTKLGLRLKSVTMNALYKKTLRLSSRDISKLNMGAILNTIYVDTEKFLLLIQYTGCLWSMPAQVSLCTYFLYQELGVSAFASTGILILLVPFNFVISWKLKQAQVTLMKRKDRRIKLMSEILNGIRVLKLNAWESSFQRIIEKLRSKEIIQLKKLLYLKLASISSFYATNSLVILASFAMFVLIDDINVLTSTKAFVSLQLFGLLGSTVFNLPEAINAVVMVKVSVSRISHILNSNETEDYICRNGNDNKNCIDISNGAFSWDAEGGGFLKDINLKVARGSLVAVVGPVGCGKSSLLSALVCDMKKMQGEVKVVGTVGYVTQQPWIQNTSLRKNILFTDDMDQKKYNQVIQACALESDLDYLPAHDQTEIGERGINLSGGQKQRVNVARAIYRNDDIYLLDDPLGAVDSHVAKHIFNEVIGPNGLLKDKTRILVTHNLTFLREVNEILFMKDGKIIQRGTYEEIMRVEGIAKEYFTQHMSNNEQKADMNPNLDNYQSGQAKPKVSELPSLQAKLTTKEVLKKGKTSLTVYIRYIKAMGIFSFVMMMILHASTAVFYVVPGYWLSLWSEDTKEGDQVDPHLRTVRLTVYGLLSVCQIVVSCVAGLFSLRGSLRASMISHTDMLRALLLSPLSFFDTTPTGRVLNRFSQDMDAVDQQIPTMLRAFGINLMNTLGTSIAVAVRIPAFIIALLTVSFACILFQRFFIATNRQLKRIYATRNSFLFSHVSGSLSGITVIRTCSAGKNFQNQFEKLIDDSVATNYALYMCERWLGLRFNLLGNVLLFCASLFTVLGKDTLSPGIVGFIISNARMLVQHIIRATNIGVALETSIVAVERIDEYCSLPSEAGYNKSGAQIPPKWPERGEVKFQDYNTRYREELDFVLKDINLKIEAGEKVGVVGRTGAGKSSLTLALFRLIEAAHGNIVVDGMDISKIGLSELRSRLTIIPQEPVMFSGTIRLNLDPFEQCDDQRLWVALEHSHLKPLVASLEQGLDHPVAEGGQNLSVGQRQLICLARALLRNTKILILDEATASVDMDTDDLIQDTIRKEFAGSTVITIAHRINTILDYDKVIVLEQGRIMEPDSPQTLLNNDQSIFHELAKNSKII